MKIKYMVIATILSMLCLSVVLLSIPQTPKDTQEYDLLIEIESDLFGDTLYRFMIFTNGTGRAENGIAVHTFNASNVEILAENMIFMGKHTVGISWDHLSGFIASYDNETDSVMLEYVNMEYYTRLGATKTMFELGFVYSRLANQTMAFANYPPRPNTNQLPIIRTTMNANVTIYFINEEFKFIDIF